MLKNILLVGILSFGVTIFAAEKVSFRSNNIKELKQAIAQKEAQKITDDDKAFYAVRLAYLQNPANVDTVAKLEQIVKANGKKYTDESSFYSKVIQAARFTLLPNQIFIEFSKIEKYKNNHYMQMRIFGQDYPRNLWTLEQKRLGAIYSINCGIERKNINIIDDYVAKYIKYTENTESSIVKNDLSIVYRKMLVLLPENPGLKQSATKVGLVLRACGVDVK